MSESTEQQALFEWAALYARISPHQLDCMGKLSFYNNCCVLAHGFDAARESIMEYLSLDMTAGDEGGNNGMPGASDDPFGMGPYRVFR